MVHSVFFNWGLSRLSTKKRCEMRSVSLEVSPDLMLVNWPAQQSNCAHTETRGKTLNKPSQIICRWNNHSMDWWIVGIRHRIIHMDSRRPSRLGRTPVPPSLTPGTLSLQQQRQCGGGGEEGRDRPPDRQINDTSPAFGRHRAQDHC